LRICGRLALLVILELLQALAKHWDPRTFPQMLDQMRPFAIDAWRFDPSKANFSQPWWLPLGRLYHLPGHHQKARL
jgi:hypothetical protein